MGRGVSPLVSTAIAPQRPRRHQTIVAEPTKRKKWSDVKARLVDRIHPEPLLEYRAVVLPADPAHGQIEGSVEIAGGERSSRWTDEAAAEFFDGRHEKPPPAAGSMRIRVLTSPG